jgi:hypothetical protein
VISERTVGPTNAAPGAARRCVLDEVGEAPKPVLESIRVMVSELASNAVLQARTEFRVRVERLGEALRVEMILSWRQVTRSALS